MAEAGRRTISRRELARHDAFDTVSPEVGVLDEDAFAEVFDDDADAAMAMLAELTGATDQQLRSLARTLAARVTIDVALAGSQRRRGITRLRPMPSTRAEGDIDLDASIDAIVDARATGTTTDPARLHVSAWQRPTTALCLLVDRSGSMAGDRLASAAVAAAAVLFRSPQDCSVVCFSDTAVVVKAQDESRPVEAVVSDVLSLRGFGTTDVGLALRTAGKQLGRSAAGRRMAVLLSDCRTTAGGDPLPHAAGIDELVVLAPAEDSADARALCETLGARWAPLGGPGEVPEALNRVLGR